MEQEKKKGSFGKVLLVIILLIVFALAGWFGNQFYGDKIEFLNFNKADEEETKEKTTKEEDVTVDDSIENLVKLVGLDYESDGMKVSEMSDEYKMNIVSKQLRGETVIKSRTVASTEEYVAASVVEEKYNSIFGDGKYKRPESIKINCYTYNYNATTDSFDASIPPSDGCGPIGVGVNEKIISAKKNGDTLKVTEAVAFLDSGNPDRNIFKEYSDVNDPAKKITSVKEIIGKDASMPTAAEWDQVDEYIGKNADKFVQYTFIFEMNKNGFYKYTGFEKTKK